MDTYIYINDHYLTLNSVVNLMDDDIREELHSVGYDTDQEFVDAYCEAHLAKYGEEFILN